MYIQFSWSLKGSKFSLFQQNRLCCYSFLYRTSLCVPTNFKFLVIKLITNVVWKTCWERSGHRKCPIKKLLLNVFPYSEENSLKKRLQNMCFPANIANFKKEHLFWKTYANGSFCELSSRYFFILDYWKFGLFQKWKEITKGIFL